MLSMLREFISSHFKKPRGLLGNWASNVMIKGNENKYTKLIKDLDLQPQDKLLEIGYGPGRGIYTIAEMCTTCTIHGIDFSKLMYKKTGILNKQHIENGRVQLQFGNFLTTTIIDNNYDKVFCLNVVYFWDELNSPFTKVLSLLKKGGAFHIYMTDKNTLAKMKAPDSVFNKYSMEQVIEALRSAGFENVEHHSEKGHYIKAIK